MASIQDRFREEGEAQATRATAEGASNDRNRVATEADKLSRQNEIDREIANAPEAQDQSLISKFSEKSKQDLAAEKDSVVVVPQKPDQPAVADAPPAPAPEPKPEPKPVAARSNPLGITGGDHVVHGDGHYFNPTAGGGQGQSIDRTRGGNAR